MTAHEQLALALADAIAQGHEIPCGTSDGWLSDDADQRAEAAQACRHCPVIDLCADAGASTSERFGVWGGIDRTPTKQRKARK